MSRALLLSIVLHLAIFAGVFAVVRKLPDLMSGGNGMGAAIVVERAQRAVSKTVAPAPSPEPLANDGGAQSPSPTPVAGSTGVTTEGSASLGDVIAWGNQGPEYPAEALKRGWEGEVKLRLHFSSEVNDVEVIHSSGFEILDDAAMKAAMRWKLPGNSSEGNSRAWVIPVEFRLRG